MPSAPAALRAVPLALAALAAWSVAANATDFYAGKSIDLYVGAPPGGGYDVYARALGRHISRHIPGNPTVVVKNMPGAGSAKTAQFIAGIAPKDGTALGAIMPGAIMAPLLDERATAFDPTAVLYIGTANSGARVCATMQTSKLRSFADSRTVKAKFGGAAPNDSTFEYGYMHKHTAGAIYDMVVGYRGTTDMSLALERGEIDGICGWDWSSFKSQKPEWLRDGKVRLLLQVGLEPNAELTRMGVPHVFDFIQNAEDRKVVELIVSQQVFQRSYIAPPGTAPAQLATLRAAFDRTMADPAFLEDAQKMRVDIEALPGSRVEAVIRGLYAAPRAVIERAKQVIRP